MKIHKIGRYEVIEELGQGAMGIVYRATDPMINRVVAIKTINMALRDDEVAEYEARFYQEARAAGGLNHPNIVTIYDIGKSGNIAFMAMEYLDGKELRELVGAGVPLPLAQAIDIASQVAQGLAYAHQNHVVHRDIKPANIMIVRGGTVKILDFGIARMRFSRTFTHTGTIVGSPRYMSPEQVLGKRTGPQSDIFSLGAVLYEMLTGRAPFTGTDVNALMFQILNVVPPPPSALNPALPELLNLVVAKAIAKSAEERYASALQLVEDLKQCKALADSLPAASEAQSEATQRAHAKIDQDLGASLQLDALPGTRRDDAELGMNEPSPTLGVAKSFDSLDATMRLAAQTGMTQELEAYAQTCRIQRTADGETDEDASATAERSGRRRRRLGGSAWSRQDRVFFAAAMAAAGFVALGVAFL